MKKVLMATLALASVSMAGAAEKIGVYLLGVQYERDVNPTDSVRFGLGLPLAAAFNGGGLLILSGDASYLRHTAPATEAVQPYYGGGLGLSGAFATGEGAAAGAVVLYPNVLGGLNFGVTDRLSLFGEASVGPAIAFATVSDGTNSASGANFSFGYGLRLGLNYQLR